VLLTQIGELERDWVGLRLLGVALSLYFLIVAPWTTRTIGRSYVPGAAILEHHELVVAGPFRFVRHPIYSGVVALWLGAALGTVNWVLLALWPLLIFGIRREAIAEEELLRGKFGEAYDAYAKKRGRLFPRAPG
jgi:protein-S-isoprenylcysteine O-methyltransferase Ste14